MSNKPLPKEIVKDLAKHYERLVKENLSDEEKLIMYSGALLNWTGDYASDRSLNWVKETIEINKLWLTGMNPKLNDLIIKRADRSPTLLREILADDPVAKRMLSEFKFSNQPILVRLEDGKYKVLDGMHRVLAGLARNKTELEALIAVPSGNPRPQCEPHVVYDLLRAYHRRVNTDKEGLVKALRFLHQAYGNIDELLRDRFSKEWITDEQTQEAIRRALK